MSLARTSLLPPFIQTFRSLFSLNAQVSQQRHPRGKLSSSILVFPILSINFFRGSISFLIFDGPFVGSFRSPSLVTPHLALLLYFFLPPRLFAASRRIGQYPQFVFPGNTFLPIRPPYAPFTSFDTFFPPL